MNNPICLIRPPAVFSKSAYSTPLGMPLGIAYLAATLRAADYTVQVIDALGEGIENIQLSKNGLYKFQGLTTEQILSKINPRADIIGFSIMFSQEWPFLKNLIRETRRVFPAAKIVLGGEHPTALPEFTLRDCTEVDLIVRGEADLTFLHLVKALRQSEDTSLLPGVALLKQGAYIENSLSPRINDMSSMPWPAWDLFNLNPYFRPNYTLGIAHGRNMAMLSTRGCPHQCTFCSSPSMWTTRYVLRPVKDVVDEMQHYVQKYQANSIDFYDLTAIVKRSWILEFAKEIQNRNLKVAWQLPAGTRSEVLDAEVLDAVSKAGLKYLAYAPESGSPRVLKEIKKQVNLPHLTWSLNLARQKGLAIKTNIVIGFPNETRNDIWKTLLLVWKLGLQGVEDCNISLFTPYPGSALYTELKKTGEIEPLSDTYFESLISQFDFTSAKTFCRNVTSFELLFYRIMGMGLFYLFGLPWKLARFHRMIKFVRHLIIQKSEFIAESVFEQRIFDWRARLK